MDGRVQRRRLAGALAVVAALGLVLGGCSGGGKAGGTANTRVTVVQSPDNAGS